MKKIWKIRRDEEAVSPVIATILMVAITVVLAAVLYIMVTSMTTGPTSLDSVGGTLSVVTGGWKFTCTGGTKDFPMATTYFVLLTETGSVENRSTLATIEDATAGYAAWYDNDDNDKLTAGDSIFIRSAYASSDEIIQISTADSILFDRTI